MVNYFWDSYAVIEFIDGNSNYTKYKDEPALITIFNLAEVYWFSLHEYGEERADDVYRKFRGCVLEIDDETLKKSVRFRKQHKHKNLSYADCIGYCMALQHNLKFLTGDKEFEGMANVEFVK